MIFEMDSSNVCHVILIKIIQHKHRSDDCWVAIFKIDFIFLQIQKQEYYGYYAADYCNSYTNILQLE